jgi:hypothetical protein
MISTLKKNNPDIHPTRWTPFPQACPRLRNRNLVAFLLLATIIFLIYSNSYNCSWHFDDYKVIVENSKLHIDNLSPESLKQTFFARPAVNGLYRPLPMLTFAINWYLGHENLWGYHLVNNSIHLLTAFFLFLAIQSLLATPVGKARGPKQVFHRAAGCRAMGHPSDTNPGRDIYRSTHGGHGRHVLRSRNIFIFKDTA